jgi:hypothetical protein
MGPIRPTFLTGKRNENRRRHEQSHGPVLGQSTGDRGPEPELPEERRQEANPRRENSLHAFVYGNFRPRRRSSRRAADSHHFIFDWYEPHLLYVSLAIVLLSCTDALFTLNLLNIGAIEVNLFMNNLLTFGIEPFLWVKIGLTTVSVLALVFAAQRKFMGWFRVYRLLHLICIGYFGLIGYEIYLFSLILDLSPLELVSSILHF